jgi:copper chaperone NosL
MKLSSRSRILLAVAAVCLAGTLVFPLWGVYLQAPQYPEGLGMHIRVNTITGVKPNDVESINNLNHYIGMKRIEADSIRELRFMPFIVAALVVFGLAAAATGRRWIGRAWVIAFAVAAIAGLADFWKWEYDYGHDLDVENAIIKVPGMNYQPPLIGSRKLLNFTATSLPDAGGVLAIVSLGLGVIALLSDTRRRRVASGEATVVPPRVLARSRA